ncbi:MAG: MerR family transcriptional regulator [Brevibacterium sp.]
MRISELSDRTGVPIPRIKYYIREGLLARALPSSKLPGGYDDAHIHRVRLIRAMVSVGGMSIAATKAVLTEIDAPSPSIPNVLGLTTAGFSGDQKPRSGENSAHAVAYVRALIESRGWDLAADEPAEDEFIDAVETMMDTGHEALLGHLDVYAEAAEKIAEADFGCLDENDSLAVIVEKTIVGTVLGEVFIASLRKLAHADQARRRFNP